MKISKRILEMLRVEVVVVVQEEEEEEDDDDEEDHPHCMSN